jgi:hypothetical protein
MLTLRFPDAYRPWPVKLEVKHRNTIEAAARGVLDARRAHSGGNKLVFGQLENRFL